MAAMMVMEDEKMGQVHLTVTYFVVPNAVKVQRPLEDQGS